MSTVVKMNPTVGALGIVLDRYCQKHCGRFFIYQTGELLYATLQKIDELYDVISTIDIGILNKVSELSRRFGLKVWQSEAFFEYSDGHYRLMFEMPTDEVGFDKFDRMMSSLGSPTESQEVVCKTLRDLDERLDQALDLAPKIRATSRA